MLDHSKMVELILGHEYFLDYQLLHPIFFVIILRMNIEYCHLKSNRDLNQQMDQAIKILDY